MASMTILFENPNTGGLKEAPIGFSWTTFFFGFIPALLRGHYGMAFAMVVISIITLGFSNLVFSFIYNKMYVKFLLGQGFKPKTDEHTLSLASSKLGIPLPTLAAA